MWTQLLFRFSDELLLGQRQSKQIVLIVEPIVLFIIIEHILFIGRLVLTILSSLPAVKLHVGYIPVTYTMPKIL